MKIKSIKNYNLLISTCLLAGILPSAASSAQLFDDFQSDTVGQSPSGAHSISPSAVVTVVDSGSTNPDPFGGVGNQSMLINTTSTGYDGNSYAVFAGDAYEAGTFSMDIYGENRNTYTYLKLGNQSSTAQGIANTSTAVNLQIRWDIWFGSWDAAGVFFNFDTTLEDGVNYLLEIDFDSSSKTWSGTINGATITAGSGTISSFDYFRKGGTYNYVVDDIDRAHLLVTNQNDGALTFVDNISIIPEPNSALMLGFGALFFGLLRRR